MRLTDIFSSLELSMNQSIWTDILSTTKNDTVSNTTVIGTDRVVVLDKVKLTGNVVGFSNQQVVSYYLYIRYKLTSAASSVGFNEVLSLLQITDQINDGEGGSYITGVDMFAPCDMDTFTSDGYEVIKFRIESSSKANAIKSLNRAGDTTYSGYYVFKFDGNDIDDFNIAFMIDGTMSDSNYMKFTDKNGVDVYPNGFTIEYIVDGIVCDGHIDSGRTGSYKILSPNRTTGTRTDNVKLNVINPRKNFLVRSYSITKKTNGTFVNWVDGDGNVYAPNATITLSKNLTLSAVVTKDYTGTSPVAQGLNYYDSELAYKHSSFALFADGRKVILDGDNVLLNMDSFFKECDKNGISMDNNYTYYLYDIDTEVTYYAYLTYSNGTRAGSVVSFGENESGVLKLNTNFSSISIKVDYYNVVDITNAKPTISQSVALSNGGTLSFDWHTGLYKKAVVTVNTTKYEVTQEELIEIVTNPIRFEGTIAIEGEDSTSVLSHSKQIGTPIDISNLNQTIRIGDKKSVYIRVVAPLRMCCQKVKVYKIKGEVEDGSPIYSVCNLVASVQSSVAGFTIDKTSISNTGDFIKITDTLEGSNTGTIRFNVTGVSTEMQYDLLVTTSGTPRPWMLVRHDFSKTYLTEQLGTEGWEFADGQTFTKPTSPTRTKYTIQCKDGGQVVASDSIYVFYVPEEGYTLPMENTGWDGKAYEDDPVILYHDINNNGFGVLSLPSNVASNPIKLTVTSSLMSGSIELILTR